MGIKVSGLRKDEKTRVTRNCARFLRLEMIGNITKQNITTKIDQVQWKRGVGSQRTGGRQSSAIFSLNIMTNIIF